MMEPNSQDIRDVAGLTPREKLNYPMLVASIAGNILLFVPVITREFPTKVFILLLGALIFIPPTVMGYTHQPFFIGVGLGVLPAFVTAVIDNPLSVAYIENMIKLGITWGGLILPVVALFFTLGVLSQERTLRGGHMQPLIWRILGAFALSGLIILIKAETRLLETGVLH